MLEEAGRIKNVVLIFRHIQCLHLVNSEVAWVLVPSGTQVQTTFQTIFPILMTMDIDKNKF